MKILLFEPSVASYRMEYINHLYNGIANKEHELFLLVPPRYKELKSDYTWMDASNIHVCFFKQEEVESIEKSSPIKGSYIRTKILCRYIKRFNVDAVFFLAIIHYLPFLPFMLPRKVSIHGIIHTIYLYNWSSFSFSAKISNVIKYIIFSKFKCFKTIYTLNDSTSANYLNRKFKTTKFKFLPDPFNDMSLKPLNIRGEFGIGSDDEVYIQFGDLSSRKGTLDIMEAISRLPKNILKDKYFIFAGRINKTIRDPFFKLLDQSEAKDHVIIKEGFLPNEFIHNLCFSCDYILVPYNLSAVSSGSVGYGAYYRKPLVGPSSGLLGRLIKKYKLGYCLKKIDAENLCQFISKHGSIELVSEYKDIIKKDNFSNIIINNFDD